MNIPPWLRSEFEKGYQPMDEPPGLEERYYQQWKAEREGRDQPEGPCNTQSPMRRPPTTREMIASAIKLREEEADDFRALLKAMPMELPPAAGADMLADEQVKAWLQQPFKLLADARAAHADMVRRNDINRYRVALLRNLLNRANERLTENRCQFVVVPDLDTPNIERLMETNPL